MAEVVKFFAAGKTVLVEFARIVFGPGFGSKREDRR